MGKHSAMLTPNVGTILEKHSATCMCVRGKFIVLGTDWGNIHVLDTEQGIEQKRFEKSVRCPLILNAL